MINVVKIVVFVPESHTEAVRESIGKAGAGVIGNYSFCSFSVKGIGRFKPTKGASPTIGSVGELESVEEERIETVCEVGNLKKVIKAIKKKNIPMKRLPLIFIHLKILRSRIKKPSQQRR